MSQVCEKVRYESKSAATQVIDGVNSDKSKRQSKKKLRYCYHCAECNGWHITSSTRKKSAVHTTHDERLKDKFVAQKRREGKVLQIKNFSSKPVGK